MGRAQSRVVPVAEARAWSRWCRSPQNPPGLNGSSGLGASIARPVSLPRKTPEARPRSTGQRVRSDPRGEFASPQTLFGKLSPRPWTPDAAEARPLPRPRRPVFGPPRGGAALGPTRQAVRRGTACRSGGRGARSALGADWAGRRPVSARGSVPARRPGNHAIRGRHPLESLPTSGRYKRALLRRVTPSNRSASRLGSGPRTFNVEP